MVDIELPLPTTARCIVVAVLDDIVVTDVVGASVVEVKTSLCVVLHPVAGDDVAARNRQIDTTVVRVRGVLRKHVAARRA